MSVLVYGATAGQGRAIASKLAEVGHNVRVLTRDPSRLDPSLRPRVAPVSGDLGDPASLDRAHAGIDTVVLTLPLVFDAEQFHANAAAALSAAERAGVRRIIYNTSVCAGDGPLGDGVLDTIREIVQAARRSPIPATVLRPPLFLENLLAPWTYSDLVEAGVLRYPLPAAVSARWIHHDTIARYVAAALEIEASNAVLDIADPAPLTGPDIASMLGGALGREVRFDPITPAAFAARAAPYIGAAGGDHLARLYQVLAADGGAVFDRDYARAQRVLGPTIVGSQAWIDTTFSDGKAVAS